MIHLEIPKRLRKLKGLKDPNQVKGLKPWKLKDSFYLEEPGPLEEMDIKALEGPF